MLTSNELFGFMSPALALEILTYTYENDKPLYRATLGAVADARKRPLHKLRVPRQGVAFRIPIGAQGGDEEQEILEVLFGGLDVLGRDDDQARQQAVEDACRQGHGDRIIP